MARLSVRLPTAAVMELGDDVIDLHLEALMDAVLAVMDAARAVVRDQDIHWREGGQECVGLGLIVEKSTTGLVLPATVEPADTESANLDYLRDAGLRWGRGMAPACHGYP